MLRDVTGVRCIVVVFGIEMHGRDRCPVARRATPSRRMFRSSLCVHEVTLGEDRGVSSRVPIVRRDKANGTVLMHVIVPLHELRDPARGGGDIGKRVRRIRGTVFERPKERFGIRIVVAHARPAEGRQHPQAFERDEHGRAFHRAAVIRMQCQARRIAVRRATRCGKQFRRVLRRFGRVHRPADDLPTPDIDDQIQVEKHAGDWRLEIGDVPRPHLIRAGRFVGAHRASHGGFRTAPTRELVRLSQDPVDRRF